MNIAWSFCNSRAWLRVNGRELVGHLVELVGQLVRLPTLHRIEPSGGLLPAWKEVNSAPLAGAIHNPTLIEEKCSYANTITAPTSSTSKTNRQEREQVLARHTTHNRMPVVIFKAKDYYRVMAEDFEVDLLKTLPDSVWVGLEYEDSPLRGYTRKMSMWVFQNIVENARNWDTICKIAEFLKKKALAEEEDNIKNNEAKSSSLDSEKERNETTSGQKNDRSNDIEPKQDDGNSGLKRPENSNGNNMRFEAEDLKGSEDDMEKKRKKQEEQEKENAKKKNIVMIQAALPNIIKRAARCTKATAMRGVRGRALPQGCIVRSFTLHFCQRLFPRLEPLTS
ncbi:hypothetical protein FXO38_29106 [Capsicum annuum]|nr:hypothetical protein FXO38_29106 [Capsicum annuum]